MAAIPGEDPDEMVDFPRTQPAVLEALEAKSVCRAVRHERSGTATVAARRTRFRISFRHQRGRAPHRLSIPQDTFRGPMKV